MGDTDQLWLDSFGFVYSADGKRLLKGANVEGAYWIPEGVEEIEPKALIGCRIGTLHVPWTAHVHEHDQLVFSENEEENEKLMRTHHSEVGPSDWLLRVWPRGWKDHDTTIRISNLC